MQERVTDHVPQNVIGVDIYDGSIPLRSAHVAIRLRAVDDNRTEVDLTFRFTPKMGLLGRLLVPLMKPQFRKALEALVEGNRTYLEYGVTLNAA